VERRIEPMRGGDLIVTGKNGLDLFKRCHNFSTVQSA
jgi:hypothetical protein